LRRFDPLDDGMRIGCRLGGVPGLFRITQTNPSPASRW
jgi:hypothetical protein